MRRAILVASSQFQDQEFHPLRFPLRDAERLRDILQDPEYCGFDEVTLLGNEDTVKAKRSLERCARLSEPGDLILFYYNGHGKLDRDGSLALAMPDTDSEILRASSLLADEIKGLFNLSRASQRIMILDCCYSGAVESHGFKGSVSDTITSLAQQLTGSFLLTASRRFERAWELEKQEAGALTEAIVDGVRTGAAAPPGRDHITLGQLAAYVRQSVPANSPQQPEYWDNGGIGELVFAKKAAPFDATWTRRARILVTHYVKTHIFDEDFAEEVRSVIASAAKGRHAHRLRLIDRLLRKDIKVNAFATAWLAADAATGDDGPPPPTAPPASPPPRPPAASGPLTPRTNGAPPQSGDAPRTAQAANPWRVPLYLLIAAALGLSVLAIAGTWRNRSYVEYPINTATTVYDNGTEVTEVLDNGSGMMMDTNMTDNNTTAVTNGSGNAQ